jgi:hypothetical protein
MMNNNKYVNTHTHTQASYGLIYTHINGHDIYVRAHVRVLYTMVVGDTQGDDRRR